MVWPLSGRELADALGVGIDPSEVDAVLTSALGGRYRAGLPGDVFFALDPSQLPHVTSVLREGATLAVVQKTWPDLQALAPELRARCVAVENPLVAFRTLAA